MKYSVALIGFWFGKLPNYFPVWLEGAKENEEWSFVLYIDDHTPYQYPSNVTVHYTTLEECVKRAQRLYDFEICVPYAYKFCDFRPAFGDIFAEDLTAYDFWGTIDLDIVLGCISHFLTEDILEQYDKIFTRDHFCLYRNLPEIREHYKGAQEGIKEFYKTAFTSPEIFAFGERGKTGVYNIWKYNNWNMLDENWCADISVWQYHFEVNSEKKKNSRQVFYHNKDGLFRFIKQNGKIEKTEFLYMHLQKRRMDYTKPVGEAFWIVPNTFIELKGQSTDAQVAELISKYSGWKLCGRDIARSLEMGTQRLKNRWKKMRREQSK